jgi:hypothetical protein
VDPPIGSIHIKEFFAFSVFSTWLRLCWREHGASNHCLFGAAIRGARKGNCRRFANSPTDDLAIADLKYRKLIIADEILHNRRLVESFSKRCAH